MAGGLLGIMESIKKDKDLKVDADTFVDPNEVVEKISTGSIIIDKLLGKGSTIGGIGRGRMTEVFGLESSGKTTFALSLCKEFQKIGENVVFVDFEAALDRDYAANGLGLDLSPERFMHLRPQNLEEGVNIVDKILEYKDANVGVIVMDSVKAMIPKTVMDGLVGDEPPMALQARRIGQWLSKITKTIKDTNTSLVLLNQMTKNIKSNPYQSGGEYETPGGLAIRFYASTRIELKGVTKETVKAINPITNKEEDMPDSLKVRASIIKNKIGDPYRRAEFFIKYGSGIDNKRSILDMASSHGIIKQGGAWYSYREDSGGFKIQGEDAMREFLLREENRGLLKEITDKLIFKQDPALKEEAKILEEQEANMERKMTKKISSAVKTEKAKEKTVVNLE